jgi:uncharacterized protein (TIGR04255 family)
MPFPEVDRVVYARNPLELVVAQFRFPAILRVESEVPSEFQDRIRQYFPLYNEKSEIIVDVPPNLQGQPPSDIIRNFIGSVGPRKNHEFVSEDGNWTVNLTRSFLALSAKDYKHWSDFKERLRVPFQALNEVYASSFISRIGLRYVDSIKRSKYGLIDVPWDQLLQPYVTGFLGSSDVNEELVSFQSMSEIRLPDDNSIVRIRTTITDDDATKESKFVIDSDFFSSVRTLVEDAVGKLDFFSYHGYRLFRWSITDKLHKAMETSH